MATPTTAARLAIVKRQPRLPGWGDCAAWIALAGVAGGLALATISVRFQLVDWRVESVDLQERLRRAEEMESQLRADIARGQRADYLMKLATETLFLQPVDPRQVLALDVSDERLARFEKAWELVGDGAATAAPTSQIPHREPVEAMVSRRIAPLQDAGRRLTDALPRPSDLAPLPPPRVAAPVEEPFEVSEPLFKRPTEAVAEPVLVPAPATEEYPEERIAEIPVLPAESSE